MQRFHLYYLVMSSTMENCKKLKREIAFTSTKSYYNSAFWDLGRYAGCFLLFFQHNSKQVQRQTKIEEYTTFNRIQLARTPERLLTFFLISIFTVTLSRKMCLCTSKTGSNSSSSVSPTLTDITGIRLSNQ